MIGALLTAALAATSTPVGVGLNEFGVAPYRDHVRPGTVRLNVHNLGEDPHDLAIRDARGHVLATMVLLTPGERGTLRVRLRKPGVYRLFCTVGDHEARGMRARLRVLQPRRTRRT
jgi:plastocyanin